ncbi:hypothetical protein [Sinorhizobium fredii]|uniref:hypothetical protein n=1 Tax=Rhizobium fredii TaxID=380 RepID=UPI0004BCFE53|nr:hypothetical protein [Sinorhizobium fredii]ASY69377.1 Terminase [Sinorhizobium fredii CCBAU 83666]
MSGHISNIVTREDIRVYGEDQVRALVAKLEVPQHFDPYNYTPPGPVAQAFIVSTVLTRFIMGPLGGGKTTACAFARIYAALLAPVARHPDDGIPTRMCRWIVLRDSFRSAEKTVLESWKQWFPKGYPGSGWAGGNDRPVTHRLRFIGPDGIRIEAITEFAGLGENSIETLMKGREYSGAWLNEADTHAPGALEDLEQRVGRYPRAGLLIDPNAKRMRFVIGDLNAPSIDSWVYQTFIKNPTPDREFFQQPSGRSAEAENRFNLEDDYYDRIVRNQDDHFVRRMVDNEFGYSRSGKPVYDSFSRARHVSRAPIEFIPKLTLNVGIDISMNSLNPAAVFGQARAPGRIAVFDELYLGHGVGAARFAEALHQRILERYGAARAIRLWLDPAAAYGADREGGQLTAMEQIATTCGLPVLLPANGSNELGMRLDAVKTELRGYLEPETHLLICSVGCPLLLEGMEGKYRYKKRPESASTEYEEQPEKTHPWSDLQDGLQYLVLGIRGRTAGIRAAADRDDDGRHTPRGDRPPRGWGSGSRAGGRGGFDPHKVGR